MIQISLSYPLFLRTHMLPSATHRAAANLQKPIDNICHLTVSNGSFMTLTRLTNVVYTSVVLEKAHRLQLIMRIFICV